MPEGSGSFGLMLAGASSAGERLPASPRRRLGIAAVVSLLLHGLVLAALLLGLAHRQRIVDAGETPAIVELVMTPPGNNHSTAPNTAPAPSRKAKPVAKPEPPPQPHSAAAKPSRQPPSASEPTMPAPQAVTKPRPALTNPAAAPPAPHAIAATPEPEPPPAPPAEARPEQRVAPAPSPPVEPQPSQATAAPASPTPPSAMPDQPAPASKPALQLSLGGLASDTNALVTGAMLLPPTADPKFRNRKPDYPPEAAERGEHGAVVLLIHVTPQGTVRGVDITHSSGYRLLDQSARDTVLSWHFLPALKDGKPVPFEMPMRIEFDLD